MVVAKKYLSANEFLSDSWRLAKLIRDGDWQPDVILALWRGGAMPGVAIHEFLKTSGLKVQHYPLKCASYSGIDQQANEVKFTLGEETFALISPGSRVLVVDDVFDSGLTAKAVLSRLAKNGFDARMACVYWKSSRNETNLKPDYFVRDTGDDWIVFPHEIEGLTRDELFEKDPSLATMKKF